MNNQERNGTGEQNSLRDPLALVGMAVRLPGADNLEEYWRLLREGRDAIAELPPERLDRDLYYDPRKGVHGKTYSTLGGLVAQRPFDRTVCPLPEELVGNADECHLTLCEVAAAACRHAGYDPLNLPLRNVGVYVGHSGGSLLPGEIACGTLAEEIIELLRPLEAFRALPSSEQEGVIREFIDQLRQCKPRRNADGGPDLAANAAASLIARAFGLNGPHMSMDAACASSLMALALAGQALQQGRIDMALVGGASFNKVDSLILFSQAQSCSASGSRPFDSQADGLISAEGYVVVVVKTLSQALADGDTVYGVIRGLGISTDGRGRSLWAPRREGQVAAIRRAYGTEVTAARVQYIEAHATSTQVGDATEVEALAEVFRDCVPAGQRIPIGSVKANIGHTLETAGIASLVKVILAMRHGVIPPAINVKERNKSIAWDRVPFDLPLREQPWPPPADGQPRRAAVNAFGIGGLNVHLVVDESALGSQLTAIDGRPSATGRQPVEAGKRRAAANADGVAIIGRGVILPGAKTVEAFWQLLVSGRDPKQTAPPERWLADLGVRPGTRGPWHAANALGGYITDFAYDWKKHKIPPKQIAHANPLQFMLLDAAEQALQEAGYQGKDFDRSRASVVVGTIFGGDFSHQLQLGLRLPEFQRILEKILHGQGIAQGQIHDILAGWSDRLLKAKPALFDETGSFTSSTLASRLSKTFDFMGGAVALDAAECSALAALSVAIDMLLTGVSNLVLCAGAQRSMDLVFYESHTMNGLLASGQPRPSLDAGASGMVPGEGVAVVLLKRLADARRDGDPIHGVIRSCAAAANRHQPRQALQLAMERAVAIAQETGTKQPVLEAVAEIETTGWCLPALDKEEVEALGAVLGQTQRRQPLLLGSTTSQFGHAQGAQGLVSLVKATLALEHGELPATFGHSQTAPILAANQLAITQTTPLPPSESPGGPLLGVSTYAFNGLAWHALLERGMPVGSRESRVASRESRVASRQSRVDSRELRVDNRLPTADSRLPTADSRLPTANNRIVRIGASSLAELLGLLPKMAADSATLLAQADARRYSPADRACLAVVADSPASLKHKLQLAADQLNKPEARPVLEEQGIFYRSGPRDRIRVACLFPGQGSQYSGMLRQTLQEVPAAEARRRELDAAMRRLGFPLFADLAWASDGQLGTDLWHTQLAMLLADLIQYAALTDLGLVPDVVAGHSYGELVALVAAGAWEVEQAAQSTRARCEAIAAFPENAGALLSTSASANEVQKILATLAQPVYIAASNAPDQTVIGGATMALAACADRLRQLGHETVTLPVPRPFHTPLLDQVQPAFQKALQQARLTLPRIPLLSSVTNRYVADPEDIRANLVTQLTSPVRYLDLVHKLARDGVTVFIEAGPQQVLTGLNRRILRDQEVLLIASDHPRRHGREQLLRVQAVLECAGAVGSQTQTNARLPASIQVSGQGPEVIHFDATLQRRQKKRAVSAAVIPPPVVSPIPHFDATTARRQAKRETAVGDRPAAVGHRPSAISQAPSVAGQPMADSRPPVAESRPQTADSRQPLADLEKFLINFVVEQTGYPPEVVELDADLEADLGIDSIKKAQLFGELREYFDITPSDDLTLDDFPTLRHVLNFLAKAPGKREWLATSAVGHRPSAIGQTSAVGHRPSAIGQGPSMPGQPTADSRQPIADLEKFLINFVVEQTGYPPEVVELDADLEADLGIDSIKKAQLFGELREYFDITPSDDLTLDDFPTLRHVLNFLAKAPGKGEWLATSAIGHRPSAIGHGPSVAGQPLADSRPPTPDCQQPAADSRQPAADSRKPTADLEKFLINFVVEQTGYPPEVVELDADLEADLGIDSIKKAQLFGELREYFDITPSDDLTLDDFPTLRHVLNFLAKASEKPGLSQKVEAHQPAGGMGQLVTASTAVLETPPSLTTTPCPPRPIIVTGTPYDMGFQQALVLSRFLRPLLLEKPRERSTQTSVLPAADLEELRGLADGLEVSLESVLSQQDQAARFKVAAVAALTAARNGATGMVLGAVEGQADERAAPRIVLRRQPRGQMAHLIVTTPGCIGGWHGLNCHGLAVLSCPLGDDPPGTTASMAQMSLVKLLLEKARDIAEALEMLRTYPRLGAWTMCLAHHVTDSLCQVEFDGTTLTARQNVDQIVATGQRQLLPGAGGHGHNPESFRQRLEACRGLTLTTLGRLLKDVPVAQPALILMQPAQGALTVDGPDSRSSAIIDRLPQSAIGDRPSALGSSARAVTSEETVADSRQPTLDNRQPTLDNRQPALDNRQKQVTYRYLLRMVDAPQPAGSPTLPKLYGPALIIGANPVSQALAQRLRQLGTQVFQLAASDQPESVVEELQRLWQEQPVPHLFLTTPFDADAVTALEENTWLRRRRRGVILPYLVCQAWVKLARQAKLMDQASLVAAIALGGDFGLSGQIPAIESGALTGLLKAIAIESWVQGHRQTPIKLIDTAVGTAPEAVVDAMLSELAVPSLDMEIAFVEGRRRLVRAFPVPLPADQQGSVTRGGTWVVTGGARGITAFVARVLGQRYVLKLHLLGTAPPPSVDPAWRDLSEDGCKQLKVTVMQEARAQGLNPPKEWQKVEKALEIDATLRDLAALGIQATYHACDVSNRHDLAQVLDRIRALDGPIHGIIHGAGIGQDARFDRKKRDKVEQCFAAKIDGAAALMDLTRSDPLRYFVAFGSISGRFGANGHTDYSAANDMLCKQVDWFRRQRPDCAAVAFHWHAWGDVGMATKPETRLALEMVNMKFMPAIEGIQHLLAELEAGAPAGEVLITDESYFKLFYPSETVFTPQAEGGWQQADLVDGTTPIHNTLIAGITPQGPDRWLTEVRLDPNADPFLREHQLQQRPLLPIVIGMEALCQAALQLEAGTKVVALDHVEAVKGLRFHTPRPIVARVILQRTSAGLVGELRADFHNREGRLIEADRLYLKAKLELASEPLASKPPAAICNPQAVIDWHPIQYLGPDGPIYHGPPLQGLRSIWMNQEVALGRIKALPLADLVGPHRVNGWIVPSGVLDACLYATAVFAWQTLKPAPSLPLSIGRLLLGRHAQTGDDCLVEVRLAGQEKDGARFNFLLFDSAGTLLLEAQDYQIVWLA